MDDTKRGSMNRVKLDLDSVAVPKSIYSIQSSQSTITLIYLNPFVVNSNPRILFSIRP